MTDAEKLFKETERERKKLGYSARHKKRGGGRYVRLPSDNLTKKEREAMNGEVKTWKERPFYTKEEFMKLPDDVQIRWINSMINRYDIGLGVIGNEILGASRTWLFDYTKTKGIREFINNGHKGPANPTGKAKMLADLEAFRNPKNANEECVPEQKEDAPKAEEPKVEAHEFPAVTCEVKEQEEQVSGEARFSGKDYLNIVALLKSLAGTGAKLTIEVTL